MFRLGEAVRARRPAETELRTRSPIEAEKRGGPRWYRIRVDPLGPASDRATAAIA